MQQEHLFIRDEVLPSWWANAIQSFLSLAAFGFQITQTDATHISVTAGANDQAAIIAVEGLWRWIEATLTVAHPGGAAGTYPVFVTAAANNIVSTPAAYTDDTNYAFGFVIATPGSTPVIVPGTVDVFRQVGWVVWDGSQITRVEQTVPAVARHGWMHATGGPDAIAPADIGAATAAALAAEIARAEAAESGETARAEAAEALLAPLLNAVLTTPSLHADPPDTDNSELLASTAWVRRLFATFSVTKTIRHPPVLMYSDQAGPMAGEVIVGSLVIELAAGQSAKLLGVRHKSTSNDGTVFKLQTDHGAHGSLTDVQQGGSVWTFTPQVGGYVQALLSSPITLAAGDEITIAVVTLGAPSLGIKVAPILEYDF